ncbi:sensor histidine kinase [Spartinivicinus marinus]|nr:HAMP domain-containing sensor histidine kinase [Spartinivicinus marinus]MCX4026389.1 HAMP domain-containing sensor histidine kinase [Spartinivicinus marinus]
MAVYSYFAFKTYRAGIYDVVIHEMIQQYEHWYRKSKQMSAKPTAKHEIYNSWDEIPTSIKQYLPNKPDTGELVTNFFMQIGDFHFHLYAYCHFDEKYTNKNYFIISYFNLDHKIQDNHFISLVNRISIITVIFILLTSTLAWFSSRKIIKATSQLAEWSNNMASPKPIQRYKELDQIANNLQASYQQIQAINQRESKFLRQLSHELRTPISVLLASTQLLEKQGISAYPDLYLSYQRILRSGRHMKDLTESLLWLAKKNTANIIPENIDIKELTYFLLKDNSYLLHNKNIFIRITKGSKTTNTLVPATLIKIIINNLIRNAFQHSYSGTIYIRPAKDYFIIKNQVMSDRDDTTGFGIGLDLVQEICQAQKWQFKIKKTSSSVTACVRWS